MGPRPHHHLQRLPPGLPRMAPRQRRWSSRKGSSSQSSWSGSAEPPTQEARLLPQLGHLHRPRDLPLLQVHPHPLVSPPQGSRLPHREQGEARPRHPLSPQHKAPVVEGPGPPAWPQPLPAPNSGKLASRRRLQRGPWPPKLRAVEARAEASWRR